MGSGKGSGTASSRTALVAGGSGAIGSRIAPELARRGWVVGVHYFTGKERAEEVVRECLDAGVRRAGGGPAAAAFGADLRRPEGAARLLDEFEAALGGPPGLAVFAVGASRDGPLVRMSEGDWDEQLALNLSACAWFVREAARRMLGAPGSGQMVLIGSYAGLRGRARGAAYSAAKAGLVGLARAAAAELGPEGVRVNVVVPGVAADGMAGGIAPAFLEEARRRSVLGSLGSADELARLVAELAGTQRVSGQVITFDSRP